MQRSAERREIDPTDRRDAFFRPDGANIKGPFLAGLLSRAVARSLGPPLAVTDYTRVKRCCRDL